MLLLYHNCMLHLTDASIVEDHQGGFCAHQFLEAVSHCTAVVQQPEQLFVIYATGDDTKLLIISYCCRCCS